MINSLSIPAMYHIQIEWFPKWKADRYALALEFCFRFAERVFESRDLLLIVRGQFIISDKQVGVVWADVNILRFAAFSLLT